MQTRPLGKTGVRVSHIALGGHEFHPDGAVKGFAKGRDATRNPDYVDPGFATAERIELVRYALEQGINYFDVTIDPEVAALGKTLGSRTNTLIQCRPQYMCYKYEAGNRGLGDLSRLKPEVERLLSLCGRKSIDVLNFGIEAPSMEDDPGFLGRVGKNIRALKGAGLIRFAACDSIDSGESYYVRMMESGFFDLIWLHFSPLWPFPAEKIFPLASKLGMGVVTREAFSKGLLFRLAEEAGIYPPLSLPQGGEEKKTVTRASLAGSAIRWILSHREISTAVLGVRNARELESNLAAANASLTAKDEEVLNQLRAHSAFKAALEVNEKRFRR